MGKLMASIQAENSPFLWLDDYAYTAKLLANGQAPWLDSAAFVAWRQKAIGLLKPSINLLSLEPLILAWLTHNPALRENMSAKKRAVVPARVLLADTAFREHVAELLNGLKAALPSLPLVIAIPSPRALVPLAYRLAHGAEAAKNVEVGEDETDACAMYLADFLRTFGEANVDALLLSESADHEPSSDEELAWYQSVWNLAEHYRWDVGIGFADGREFTGSAPTLSFLITAQPCGSTRQGIHVDASFWQGQAAPTLGEHHFLALTIPVDAVPEDVLARLAVVRS